MRLGGVAESGIFDAWKKSLSVLVQIFSGTTWWRCCCAAAADVVSLACGSGCIKLSEAFDFRGHYCLVFDLLGMSMYDFLRYLYSVLVVQLACPSEQPHAACSSQLSPIFGLCKPLLWVKLLKLLVLFLVHDPACCRQNSYRAFSLQEVQVYGRQLLQAVAFLHSMHLIHTDLKLENVCI